MDTALAEQLMTTVARLRRLVRRRVSARLTPLDPLRGAQLELLRVVEKQPGIGVAAAARELRLKGNSVSTLVNQLVDAGMLHRTVDPADRRAALLELTPEAKAHLVKWRRVRTEVVATKLDDLSEEDVQVIRKALPALRRLMTSIEEDDA